MRVEATEDYLSWVNGLGDRVGRARIQVRVDRLAHGNPGVIEFCQVESAN